MRPPLPHADLHPDADFRRRSVRALSVRRPGAGPDGDAAAAISRQPAKGSGPDYSKADSWFARPGFADDPSHWVPEGVADADRSADAARPRPSTSIRPPISSATAGMRRSMPAAKPTDRADLFVQSQASAFDAVSDVWAPKYRQAAFGAFLLTSEDADKALDLAYRDVARRIRRVPDAAARRQADHPGRAQPGLAAPAAAARGPEGALNGRLVAAYVVGWPVGIRPTCRPLGLPPAPTRTRPAACSAGRASRSRPTRRWSPTPGSGPTGLTGTERAREDMLCTNPLTGTKDGSRRAAANQGTLVPDRRPHRGDAWSRAGSAHAATTAS